MSKCKLEMKWREFHKENPKIARALFKLAIELKNKGCSTYGLPALWEVLRYNLKLDVPGMDYRYNNNFKAYYARYLMLKHPRLDGFFKIRSMNRNGEPDLSDLI